MCAFTHLPPIPGLARARQVRGPRSQTLLFTGSGLLAALASGDEWGQKRFCSGDKSAHAAQRFDKLSATGNRTSTLICQQNPPRRAALAEARDDHKSRQKAGTHTNLSDPIRLRIISPLLLHGRSIGRPSRAMQEGETSAKMSVPISSQPAGALKPAGVPKGHTGDRDGRGPRAERLCDRS